MYFKGLSHSFYFSKAVNMNFFFSEIDKVPIGIKMYARVYKNPLGVMYLDVRQYFTPPDAPQKEIATWM